VYLKNQARNKRVEMADNGMTAKPSKADASPNAHSVSAFKNGGFVKLRLSFGRKASIKAGTTNRALAFNLFSLL
jgi:hypothetical protein